jgi:hypothetical protein
MFELNDLMKLYNINEIVKPIQYYKINAKIMKELNESENQSAKLLKMISRDEYKPINRYYKFTLNGKDFIIITCDSFYTIVDFTFHEILFKLKSIKVSFIGNNKFKKDGYHASFTDSTNNKSYLVNLIMKHEDFNREYITHKNYNTLLNIEDNLVVLKADQTKHSIYKTVKLDYSNYNVIKFSHNGKSVLRRVKCPIEAHYLFYLLMKEEYGIDVFNVLYALDFKIFVLNNKESLSDDLIKRVTHSTILENESFEISVSNNTNFNNFNNCNTDFNILNQVDNLCELNEPELGVC